MPRSAHMYDIGSASSRPNESSSDGPAEYEPLEGFYAEQSPSARSHPGSEMVLNPVYLGADAHGDCKPTQRWAGPGRAHKDAAMDRNNAAPPAASPSPYALSVQRGGARGWTRLLWALVALNALIAIAALALSTRSSNGDSDKTDTSAAAIDALRADVDQLYSMLNGSAVNALREQTVDLTQRLDAAETRADSLETRLSEMETAATAQAERMDALATTLTQAESKATAAVADAEQAHQDAEAAKVQAEAAVSTMAMLMTQIASQGARLPAALAARVSALEVFLAGEVVSDWLRVPRGSDEVLAFCPLYADGGAMNIEDGTAAMNFSTMGVLQQLGTSSTDYGYSVAVSADDVVFVTGFTEGDLFDSNAGGNDAFVARLSNSNDSVVWGWQFGSGAADTGRSLAVGSDGGVYVTGSTEGAMYGSNAGGEDVIVVRLSSVDGSEVWGRQFGGGAGDVGRDVAVSADGDVYVTGYTGSDMYGSNAGSDDIFIARLSSVDGTEVWGRQFGGRFPERGHCVTVSADGDVYVTGYTSGNIYSSNLGGDDVFVVRLNSADGTNVWGRQFGSSTQDVSRGLAVGADGGVYVTGYTSGPMYSSNAGGEDIFVTRLRSEDGAEVWGRQFGSSSKDRGHGLAVSLDGGVYVTGTTNGALYGSNTGNDDIFVAHLGSGDGTEGWGRQFGSGSTDQGNGVAVSTDGDILVTGVWDNDVFLLSLGPNGTRCQGRG